MGATLIKGGQIQITDFIKAIASVNWSSDNTSPSAAAVLAKIQSEIAGVSGAMQFRGAWTQAITDSTAGTNSANTIKKGYVYVYEGSGTAPTGVTLENGDTLIAKQDAASPTNSNHWTVVQVNITGAVTLTNFTTGIISGNSNSLTITAGTGTNAGKIVITANFPTISGGSAESGKYVSGISINATTGVITVTKASLPTMPDYRENFIRDEVPTGEVNGENGTFYTTNNIRDAKDVVVYVNGVRQHAGSGNDIVITKVTSGANTGKGQIVFQTGAYKPQDGDTITCDYTTATA